MRDIDIEPRSCATQFAVTQEMLFAGNDAMSAYWVELTAPDGGLAAMPKAVVAIYRAMEAARLTEAES